MIYSVHIRTWIALAGVLAVHCLAAAADLSYQTDGTTGTVWSIGPDRVDNHGLVVYDPTNGAYSSGDILYPTATVASDGTQEGEMLAMAIRNVNAVGYGLQRCKSDNNTVPTPTLRSSMQVAITIWLTTPIAYVYDSPRDTKYGFTSTTIETKKRARDIATALQSFYHDWNQYPQPPLNRAYLGPPNIGTLTSPIAYLTSIPTDPYKPTQVFGYQTNSFEYLLNSAGPDGDYDVPNSFSSSFFSLVATFVKPYDYNSTVVSKNGDITYTNKRPVWR